MSEVIVNDGVNINNVNETVNFSSVNDEEKKKCILHLIEKQLQEAAFLGNAHGEAC